MEYSELRIGMAVYDGPRFGIVQKIYKKTVHVYWGCGGKWIYDLDHLQFLSPTSHSQRK